MKLKMNMYHKGAIVLLMIGMAITIAGLVMFFKYINIKDVSELDADDVKNGVYVHGRLSRIMYFKSEETTDLIPFAVYASDSPTGKDKAAFALVLTDIAPKSGKYLPVGIDQYLFPENYQYLFGLALNFEGGDPSIVPSDEFEGIICKNDEYTKAARERAGSAMDNYEYIAVEGEILTEMNGDEVSDFYIEMKDMTARRFIWMIGLPPLLGGVVLLFLAGSPFKKQKQK